MLSLRENRSTILNLYQEKERLTIAPAITQTTVGYILDYPLYVHGKLIGLPLLTNLLFSEILQDDCQNNYKIQEHLALLKNMLKQRYTPTELCNLASYVLEKLPQKPPQHPHLYFLL